MDFTQLIYTQLISQLIERYPIYTVVDFIQKMPEPPFLVLRHDVDLKVERTLDIARIESELGIRSTYYFRMVKEIYVPSIITDIAKMGHEVGYHYETVDKAKGDIKLAKALFKQELEAFRGLVDVKTVCMHGNSRTEWDNRDLWKTAEMNKFDLVGEPYLSIDYSDVLYLTDSSRSWDPYRYKILDRVQSDVIPPKVRTTGELRQCLQPKRFPKVSLLVHPDEWARSSGQAFIDSIEQGIKNSVKVVIIRKKGIKR